MRRVRAFEALCWAVSASCLFYGCFAWQEAHAARAHLSAIPSQPAPASGQVLGELRIAALALAVPVVEDDTRTSLLRGVGHIPGTAMPGGLGTVGLAGHRDTFLRPLARVAPSMAIDVSRGASTYRYIVDRTAIVQPEAVDVLDTQNTPELVLVTCYPFHYIGAAPLRFVVYAHLLSLTPEPAQFASNGVPRR